MSNGVKRFWTGRSETVENLFNLSGVFETDSLKSLCHFSLSTAIPSRFFLLNIIESHFERRTFTSGFISFILVKGINIIHVDDESLPHMVID